MGEKILAFLKRIMMALGAFISLICALILLWFFFCLVFIAFGFIATIWLGYYAITGDMDLAGYIDSKTPGYHGSRTVKNSEAMVREKQ